MHSLHKGATKSTVALKRFLAIQYICVETRGILEVRDAVMYVNFTPSFHPDALFSSSSSICPHLFNFYMSKVTDREESQQDN